MDFKNFIESLSTYIDRVSQVDDIENWKKQVKGLPPRSKKYVYEFGAQKWIERKIKDDSLLLHPLVKKELIERRFKPLKRHRQMIYTSIWVSYEKPDSIEHFKRLKTKVTRKHYSKWWKGVYDRLKVTFAVKQELKRRQQSNSKAILLMAEKTTFGKNALKEERDRILSRLSFE